MVDRAGDEMDAIVLDEVSVVYEGERVPAIHDISMRIAEGEFVTIIGPNGSGKTTLLEAINGLLEPTRGRIQVFGLDVSRCGSAVRKRVGYVVQSFAPDPLEPFLCRDVVMMGRAGRIGLLRFPKRRDWEAVDQALRAVGMEDFADRPVGKLSGGELQKILLARAMAQDPDLVLLDEPLANLDVDSRKHVMQILDEWRRQRRLTTLMVSHNLDEIPRSCQRIVVMKMGRILMDGPRDRVLSSPGLRELFPSLGGGE